MLCAALQPQCAPAHAGATRGARRTRCRATAPTRRAGLRVRAAAAASDAPPAYTPLQEFQASLMRALFAFPPFFKFATNQARSMMVARGAAIGVDWESEIESLRSVDWEAERAKVEDKTLQLPAYYLAPFHAYETGNLSWQAALEVEVAAKSVHAVVFDPQSKALDPSGDASLRASFHATAARMLRGMAAAPKAALDIGCATGLSSLALRKAHPGVSVTGVDLSPYFLAVGAHLQQRRRAAGETEPPFTFRHAAAEATGLPGASFDLVSMCLVAHELPQAATRAIIAEAFRLLRPGGALQIMEMDPRSPILSRVRSNPFAFTAFASTEPYLEQYLTLPLEAALREAGFEEAAQAANSPRHRTVVAHKP